MIRHKVRSEQIRTAKTAQAVEAPVRLSFRRYCQIRENFSESPGEKPEGLGLMRPDDGRLFSLSYKNRFGFFRSDTCQYT
ncbi:Uncharacterized protein dnm_024190 [Desulfonema magnum]|uniref:Uncharacterized protein n=1 Tax=Desulfonema magnum TaxID=45655 RepID=A0A975BJP9_9BACT|nr:Uncharacterized protein dnm_024190 [Desulfonema magnum]